MPIKSTVSKQPCNTPSIKYPRLLTRVEKDWGVVVLATSDTVGVVVAASRAHRHWLDDPIKTCCNFSGRSWVPFKGSVCLENGKD